MPFRHSEDIKNQKFVLDNLKFFDDGSELFQKFQRASLVSYNTINNYGRFPDRKYS